MPRPAPNSPSYAAIRRGGECGLRPVRRAVLTAFSDNIARLWDAGTGAQLAVLRGHQGEVLSALFDPSGVRVLTASEDGTARIWRVFPTVAALVEYPRAIMPRGLTQEHRKQFFLE
jgi:WD40 repeat protein